MAHTVLSTTDMTLSPSLLSALVVAGFAALAAPSVLAPRPSPESPAETPACSATDCDPCELQRLSKECDAKQAVSCNNLGVVLRTGAAGPLDEPRAIELFERACRGGFGEACSNLGAMHENGRSLPADDVVAARLYALACERGSALGCSNLGALYHVGKGVRLDRRRAAELFEKACSAGLELGCSNLRRASLRSDIP